MTKKATKSHSTTQNPTTDHKGKDIAHENAKAQADTLQRAAENPGTIKGTTSAVPMPPKRSGEQRLFQVGPDPSAKVWLTEDEAKEKGFFWNPKPEMVNTVAGH
jgi:hypothetical protein